MIIRTATGADASRIADIHNFAIRETLQTFNSHERAVEDVAKAIETGIYLVAEIEGQVVGFVSVFQFRNGVGYKHSAEHTLYLDVAARGNGGGRALMLAAESAAKDAGYHVLVAGITAANPLGVTFHEKMGFEHVGRMPEVGCKNGQWLDLILMQKILD